MMSYSKMSISDRSCTDGLAQEADHYCPIRGKTWVPTCSMPRKHQQSTKIKRALALFLMDDMGLTAQPYDKDPGYTIESKDVHAQVMEEILSSS